MNTLSNCLIFCHTRLLWSFCSLKKLNTGSLTGSLLCWFSGCLRHLHFLFMVYLWLQRWRSLIQDFYDSEASYYCFLWKKTRDKRSFFCCGRRNSCFRISNAFLKALIECSRHVQITVVYLSTLEKSSQASRSFSIFTKLYRSSDKWFCLIGED